MPNDFDDVRPGQKTLHLRQLPASGFLRVFMNEQSPFFNLHLMNLHCETEMPDSILPLLPCLVRIHAIPINGHYT